MATLKEKEDFWQSLRQPMKRSCNTCKYRYNKASKSEYRTIGGFRQSQSPCHECEMTRTPNLLWKWDGKTYE